MSKFEINRNGVFFIINVNAILTLQLRPHVGHFDGFMATYVPKLKWAWQAECLSHTLLILKIYTTYKDVQMMLKHFFDISTHTSCIGF